MMFRVLLFDWICLDWISIIITSTTTIIIFIIIMLNIITIISNNTSTRTSTRTITITMTVIIIVIIIITTTIIIAVASFISDMSSKCLGKMEDTSGITSRRFCLVYLQFPFFRDRGQNRF